MEEKPNMGSQCLLVALPQLNDPNFHQSVTLITEFNQEGAMGFILNRPIEAKMENFTDAQGADLNLSHVKPFWGGPVRNDCGYVLHQSSQLADDSIEVCPGLYSSGSTQVLKHLVDAAKEGELPFKLFLGYAGWGPGQLEQELAHATWFTLPIDKNLVFLQDPTELWHLALQQVGARVHQFSSQDQALAH